MYTVIGGTKSRAFRVMWMLEELGQPYTLNPAAPRSEEARKYNPSGKIPALVDGDEVLTDSLAIMTYLADKHGALTAPAGTPERAVLVGPLGHDREGIGQYLIAVNKRGDLARRVVFARLFRARRGGVQRVGLAQFFEHPHDAKSAGFGAADDSIH